MDAKTRKELIQQQNQGEFTTAPQVNVSPFIGQRKENISIATEVEPQPARITGDIESVSDYAREELEDPGILTTASEAANKFAEFTGLLPLSRGFNRVVLGLADTAIDAISSAVGMDSGDTGANRKRLLRIFNSNDFESQKVIIPYLLNIGVGDYVGASEEDTLKEKALSTAGEFIGYSSPFFPAQVRAAGVSSQALPNIVSKIKDVSQLSKTSTLPMMSRQMVDEATTTLAKPFTKGAGPIALAKEASKKGEAAGRVFAENVGSQLVKAPGVAVGTDLAFSAAGGASIPTIEKPVFGTQTGLLPVAPLVAPTVISSAANGLGNVWLLGRGLKWLKNKIGAATDELAVATGKKDPTEGEKGKEAQNIYEQTVRDAESTTEGALAVAIARQIENLLGDDVQFTPAERTLDKDLIATQKFVERQRGVVGKESGREFDRKNTERKYKILQAAMRYLNRDFSFDSFSKSPILVMDKATKEYDEMLIPIGEKETELVAAWRVLTDPDRGLMPKIKVPRRAGREIRKEIEAGHKRAMEETQEIADKLKINSADQWADANSLVLAREELKEIVLTEQQADAISYPGLPKVIKDFLESDKTNITFQDWKMYRDQLSTAVRTSESGSDQRMLLGFREIMDKVGGGQGFGATKEKLEKFRDIYFTNVVLPYERATVVKISSKGKGSRPGDEVYHTADEDVIKAFLKDSNTAQEFMQLFGNNPERMRDIKNVLLDQLRDKAYVASTGKGDADAVNAFINSNRAVLQQLGLLNDFTNTETQIRNMLLRNAELQTRREGIETNRVYKRIAQANDTENPVRLIDDALTDPQLMRELRNTAEAGLTGEEAKTAANMFRAVVLDRVFANAMPEALPIGSLVGETMPNVFENPVKLISTLNAYEQTLKTALGLEHYKNLQLMANGLQRIQEIRTQGGEILKPDDINAALERATGTSIRGLTTLARAAAEQRIGAVGALAYVYQRAASAQSTARALALFQRSMFDPDMAKLLVGRDKGSGRAGDYSPNKISTAKINKMNAYLFSAGVGMGDITTGERLTEKVLGKPEPRIELFPETTRKESIPLDIKTDAPKIELPTVPDSNRNPRSITLDPITITAPPEARAPVNTNQGTPVSATELFPYDPTLAAIERRRSPNKTGIMSLT